MAEIVELGLDTLEVTVEKTLQNLSSFNFKDITKHLNSDQKGHYSLNVPVDRTEKEQLTGFITMILELSRLTGIKEDGVARKDVEDVLEKAKTGDLSLLKRHASEEGSLIGICLSLAGDQRAPQGRTPLPFTGGNLGIWVNTDRSISFTGNRRYDKAAKLFTDISKQIGLKISD